MRYVPLVETTRGGHVENVHFGAIAVVDASGKLLWQAGDPQLPTFSRSSLKPFQALPFVRAGGHRRLGLSQRELAIICASHNGQDKHVEAVRGILAKAGVDEAHLECGCEPPLYYETLGLRLPDDRKWRQVQHNCSGKHAGFLAWCVLHGAPLENYVDPAHPLQREIRRCLGETAGIDGDRLPEGMDGCAAPNYMLPLATLAHLFARLSQGAADAQHGEAMGALRDAMLAHPDMISGDGSSDLAWCKASRGDWLCKEGADGVQAAGIVSKGLGIAIKVADGGAQALQPAFASVLTQLGLVDESTRQVVEQYRQKPVRNWRGVAVGEMRPVFRLARAGS